MVSKHYVPLLAAALAASLATQTAGKDEVADRLRYTDPSRFIPLADLTVGGMPGGQICLCKSRNAAAKGGDDSACAAAAELCPAGAARTHQLPAALENGHQGYWYEGLRPALVVSSGDSVEVEMVAAGVNACRLMGMTRWWWHPALEALFAWGPDGPAIGTEGALGGGEGNHWLSGPIYVCGATPGDVLQVEVHDLKPRPNPGKDGRSYGWTGTPWWGYPWGAGFKTGKPREIVTVIELETDSEGHATQAVPLYSFNFKDLNLTTPCAPDEGLFPCTTDAGAAAWDNSERLYGDPKRLHGNTSRPYIVPCQDGEQRWEHLVYVGWPLDIPKELRDYGVADKFRTKANLHIGNMGVAPAVGVPVSSAIPSRTGGNIDQKRLTAGASLYLPVEVHGALLSLGDGHGAMGDGEIGGTGVEVSLNARIRVTLHKADSLPSKLQGLSFPLLENDDEYVVNAFAFPDYLRQLEKPQSTVGGAATLEAAFANAYNQTRDFLMAGFGPSEEEAIVAISLGVDFGITQVVDANLGVHALIPKSMFASR